MRINIEIIAPWLLGNIKKPYTWKIWLYHTYSTVFDSGFRLLGVHVHVTKAAKWSGLGVSLNF
jgi:hypothetical protein